MAQEPVKNADETYKFPIYCFGGRYYGGSLVTSKYLFPIDQEECSSCDIWNKVFLLMRNNTIGIDYAPPRGQDHKILDLGGGTGVWAFSVAEQYPDIQVVAVDFNRHQPAKIPRNVSTVHFDIEDISWNLSMNFSLAHLRLLYGSIATNLWPDVYNNVYKHLSPDGWIEHSELDLTPRYEDPPLWQGTGIADPVDYKLWSEKLLDRLDKWGRGARIDSARTIRQLKASGFVDIEENTVKCCVGPWSGHDKAYELGRWTSLAMGSSFEAMSLRPMCDPDQEDSMPLDAAFTLWEKARKESLKLIYRAYLTM